MFRDLIEDASFYAHGYCLLWKPWLVSLHAVSDLLTFVSYSAIPIAILIFLKRRKDLELRQLAVLFSLFIFLCGLTHLLGMVTLWIPIYETQGIVKALNALVSVVTAAVIFPLIPAAVAIPSPRALQSANKMLRDEVEAHQRTLAELNQARALLEQRVIERTKELEHSRARLEALVRASAQIVWTRSAQGELVDDTPSWREFTGQTSQEMRGFGWLDVVHESERELVKSLWMDAVETGSTYDTEYRLKHRGGDYRWVHARGVPLFKEDGSVAEWVGMNADITARKIEEEKTKLILRELSHRTKNLLAVISALARRTLIGKGSSPDQAAKFISRLHSLARSHDLLVQSDWQGVDIRELVTTHLDPFPTDPSQVQIDGPHVVLGPQSAQHLGLAFHELATNAAKHGALTTEAGKLAITWKLQETDGEQRLILKWAETGGPPLEGSPRSGFGRYLLENLVGSALGGSATYELNATGLTWTLSAPVSRLLKQVSFTVPE
jgi:PAS domain S-box-containing protein